MIDICPLTDLPVDECACPKHHRPGTGIHITAAQLERLSGRPMPEYRHRIRPQWHVPTPEPTVCEHRQDNLCPDCDQLLDGLLADLPHLVEELGYAMRKDVRFALHGFRRGDVERPEEAPIPWNPAAARILGDLNQITAAQWDDRRALLAELSRLASAAHRAIDRPRERSFTMCPTCRTEIQIHYAGVDVVCPECAYSAPWGQHQRDLLDASGDALLTMSDLLVVLNQSGEAMTRDRINKMISRHGLPRERIKSPHWREGCLVTEPQWMYRLRDVRDLQAQIDTRKAG